MTDCRGRHKKAAPISTNTLALVWCAAQSSCVPTGSAPSSDAGTSAPLFRPSVDVMTRVFEDTFDRPDGGALSAPPAASSAALSFADASPAKDAAHDAFGLGRAAFDQAADPAPSSLGPDWTQAKTQAWRIENGRLCAEKAKNHGVWLNRTLPVNARIEFDAYALTDQGDLKAEAWGDGRSFATSTSYTNATSYLAILGGWSNSMHVLARIDEHGKDRRELHVDPTSDDLRQRGVVRGQLYQFRIERSDGKTVRWSVNGVEMLTFSDPAPLAGQGHDHFGFNEWEAKVCFDNVRVTPL